MKYRRLGKTDLNVSVVGVGTWQLGGEWGQTFTQANADAILGRAEDLGINLVDTAECYGDHLSESLVGQALKGRRDRWIVATKFGHGFAGSFQRSQHWSTAEVRQQLEDSLRALQTDHIDLYQAHGDAGAADPQLWQMLAGQVQAGKIRHLGFSLSGSTPNPEIAAKTPPLRVEALQFVYNRLDRTPETTVFPLCREHDLGVLARVPLASGLLSGKYKPGARFTAESDIRRLNDPAELEVRLRQVEEIARTEVPAGVSMAAWALAWCLRRPEVSCVIPGSKSAAQVEANALAAELSDG